MHKNVLPLLLGFILLGALGRATAPRNGAAGAAAPAQAPLRQANTPKQQSALAGARTMDAGRMDGIAPLPAFIPEQEVTGEVTGKGAACATAAPVQDGQHVCVWAI